MILMYDIVTLNRLSSVEQGIGVGCYRLAINASDLSEIILSD